VWRGGSGRRATLAGVADLRSDGGPGLLAAARVWAGIGFTGFGGPAGQISLMHRAVVAERGWIDEERFTHALSLAMLLPGPEAQQLATYLGWWLHGVRGGLLSGTLFLLPGALIMAAVSALYVTVGQVPAVAGLLNGLQAAVVALVVQALVRLGRRTLTGALPVTLAIAAFAAMSFTSIPFPAIIAASGVIGWLVARTRPVTVAVPPDPIPRRRTSAALRAAVIAAALWLASVLAILGFLPGTVYAEQAVLWSQAALLTFGGAYAILGFVAEQAVDVYGWLSAGEMATGLGLAETTPGPLILVLEYVGFVGAYGAPGTLPPLVAGLIGAVLTVWVLFVPAFFLVFATAPFMERLRSNGALRGALAAITAAVVGVIATLALWFAEATFFAETSAVTLGPLDVTLPVWGSVQWVPLVIALTAGALLALRRPLLIVLGVCSLLGLLQAVAF
jgi:chromate transporter